MAIWLRWLAVVCLFAGAASSAFAAKTYTDNGDGTVTDPTTGLQWMRCSMGQTWDGTTCTGTASTYTWDQANALSNMVTFAGYSDWRLPNIRELQTIVDRSVFGPAIDSGTFPNAPNWNFWSNSPSARSLSFDSSIALSANFNYGESSASSKSYPLPVRLVRAGMPLGLLDIGRPNTDYVDQVNGTVSHTPTRLVWQRCVNGQSWVDGTCSGTATTHTWDAAKQLTSTLAGHTDWRLPTLEELFSLVDYNRYSPALSPSLFPNTPDSFFWSASVNASNSSGAWSIHFADGYALVDLSIGNAFHVRLVRAGQCLGPLVLTVSKIGAGQVNSTARPGVLCNPLSGSGFYADDVVNLVAIPAANFISWGASGACSGTNPTCTVTMDAAKSVTANFLDTPLISGLPSALSFALQNIGSTSSAQQITLSNTGTTALSGLSFVASTEYAVTHNCGIGLGSGGNCTLNVTFRPTGTGTRSGSITISSNAPGTPHSIALSGTGQGSTSVASPTSLSFGNQGIGTTSPAQTVTLSNTGGAVLNITSKVANGDFAISSSTCGATLAPASSCIISVTFKPNTLGAQISNLVISSDAISSPTTTVTLNGTGTAVPLASLNPISLIVPAQTVNTQSTEKTVVLTNTGGAALTLAAGSITASAEFAVTNNCGGGLGSGGFCNLSVFFTPTAIGNRTGTVTIASNAVGSPTILYLSGIGRSPNAPVCTLSAVPTQVRKDKTAILTATCTPAATSYSWTGGTCAGTTASTCTVTPAATTTYSVTGTNSYGSSIATFDLKVMSNDLTPILMLLLD